MLNGNHYILDIVNLLLRKVLALFIYITVFQIPLIGETKVQFMTLKTKDNVVLAGPSQL